MGAEAEVFQGVTATISTIWPDHPMRLALFDRRSDLAIDSFANLDGEIPARRGYTRGGILLRDKTRATRGRLTVLSSGAARWDRITCNASHAVLWDEVTGEPVIVIAFGLVADPLRGTFTIAPDPQYGWLHIWHGDGGRDWLSPGPGHGGRVRRPARRVPARRPASVFA